MNGDSDDMRHFLNGDYRRNCLYTNGDYRKNCLYTNGDLRYNKLLSVKLEADLVYVYENVVAWMFVAKFGMFLKTLAGKYEKGVQ